MLYPTSKEIARALRSLGNTPSKVARKLRDKGVRGYPSHNRECPISKFLEGKFACSFSTIHEQTRPVIDGAASAPATPLPRAVQKFIPRFDACKYPKLIA